MEQSISVPFLSETPAPTTGVGFRVRFAARLVDMIVHYIIWYGAAFVISFSINLYAALAGVPALEVYANSDSSRIIGFILALLGTIFYSVFSEYIFGASLGKLIFKIRVINSDGSPLSFKAALIRSAAYFIDGMFVGLVAYDSMKRTPLRQRYGDKWANTVVVKRSSLAPSQLHSGWKFVLAFVIAVMADGLCAVVSTLISYL